jgi:hypothetical protein
MVGRADSSAVGSSWVVWRSVVIVAAVSALALTGAAGSSGTLGSASANSQQTQVRIYDPSHRIVTEVRTRDVIRESARAMRDPAGNAAVFFRLTAEGAVKFQTLTRALAHRGAKVHRNEHLAIRLGDFLSRPIIDYRLSPSGLSPKPGIEVLGMTIAHARRLAREIRQP